MTLGPEGSGGATGSDPGRALCELLMAELPVSGASISVVGELGSHSVVGATDELAVQLEASQFQLGVGPHWDALQSQRPAFLYNLAEAADRGAWPSLVTAALRLGSAALFAFPLRLGEATVGVADLYSRTPVERWSDDTIARAEDLVVRLAEPAVRIATRSADSETDRTGSIAVELRREVHQATGMVMAQLDTDAATAFVRLRAHAFATGVPLETLARDVVRRRVNLAEH